MVLSLRADNEELSDADVEALNAAVKLLDEVNARFKRMEESLRLQAAATKMQMEQLQRANTLGVQLDFIRSLQSSENWIVLPEDSPVKMCETIPMLVNPNSADEFMESVEIADDSIKDIVYVNPKLDDVELIPITLEVLTIDSYSPIQFEDTVVIQKVDRSEVAGLEATFCGAYHKWSLCTQGVCENALEIFCSYYGNILSGDDVEFKLLWPKNSFLLPPDKPPDDQSTEKVLDANITEKYYTNMRNEITCVNGRWCAMLDEFRGSEFMEFQPRCLWFVVLDALEDSGKLWVVLRCIGEDVNWVWKFIILRWLTLDSGMQFEIVLFFFLQVPMVVCIIGMELREWQMDHSTISTILLIICLTFGYEATHISTTRCLLVAAWCYLFSVLHFFEISTTERSLMTKRMGDFKFLFTDKSLMHITTVQQALLGWGVLAVGGSGIAKFDIKVGITMGKEIWFLLEIWVTEGVSFILRLSMFPIFSLPRPPDSTMNFLNLEDKVLRRGKECYGCNLGHKCNIISCYK